MRLRVPDWLSYEIRHKVERLRNHCEQLHIEDSINENPRTVVGVTTCSILLGPRSAAGRTRHA